MFTRHTNWKSRQPVQKLHRFVWKATVQREVFLQVQGSQVATGRTTERAPKTREKTREKILVAIKENPMITAKNLADIIGITIKGVEWQIKDLKSQGIIRRVGPDKGGHWEIIESNA